MHCGAPDLCAGVGVLRPRAPRFGRSWHARCRHPSQSARACVHLSSPLLSLTHPLSAAALRPLLLPGSSGATQCRPCEYETRTHGWMGLGHTGRLRVSSVELRRVGRPRASPTRGRSWGADCGGRPSASQRGIARRGERLRRLLQRGGRRRRLLGRRPGGCYVGPLEDGCARRGQLCGPVDLVRSRSLRLVLGARNDRA